MDDLSRHERHLRRALALARQAANVGNHPFGALLVRGTAVLCEAENTVGEDGDPTRHAELNLVSLASREHAPQTLSESTRYTSTEPCAMCCGAIYWSGIRKVVFSVRASELEKLAPGGIGLSSRELFNYAAHAVEVVGPILEGEGLEIHRRFWR